MALIALHKGMLALTLFAVSAHAAPIANEEVRQQREPTISQFTIA
jgi:hypothetical protein